MVTKIDRVAFSTHKQILIGSEPTVWDGDHLLDVVDDAPILVLSPPCGMVTRRVALA